MTAPFQSFIGYDWPGCCGPMVSGAVDQNPIGLSCLLPKPYGPAGSSSWDPLGLASLALWGPSRLIWACWGPWSCFAGPGSIGPGQPGLGWLKGIDCCMPLFFFTRNKEILFTVRGTEDATECALRLFSYTQATQWLVVDGIDLKQIIGFSLEIWEAELIK